jgi:hypothetical protein
VAKKGYPLSYIPIHFIIFTINLEFQHATWISRRRRFKGDHHVSTRNRGLLSSHQLRHSDEASPATQANPTLPDDISAQTGTEQTRESRKTILRGPAKPSPRFSDNSITSTMGRNYVSPILRASCYPEQAAGFSGSGASKHLDNSIKEAWPEMREKDS